MNSSRASILLALAGCLLCSSCLVGPAYKPPVTAVPATWHHGERRDLRERDARLESWWKGFGDKTLVRLIEKARKANPNVEMAASRVREARLQRRVAQGQLFPAVEAQGAFHRVRASGAVLAPVPATNPSNDFSTGFDAGWELDLFGGVRRRIEAADALIGASEEAYSDVLITLFAEVALNYIEVRTLQERLDFAGKNIERQRESVTVTESRLEAGIAPEIDVTQAKSNLYASESFVPQLEAQLAFAKNRLATLLGGFPGSPGEELERSGAIPRPAEDFGYGLPADLVRSRPDIRRAERELAAQSAMVGVAVSELYPKFTLAGSFSFDAVKPGDLFEADAGAIGFGPSFRWNLFNAGRVRNAIRIEEERLGQSYAAYEEAVLRGVEEVENAMVAVLQEGRRLEKLEAAVNETRATVSKITGNYMSGLVDFQNVLDAQRSLFGAEDDAAMSRGQIARNHVTLYKALGGGAPPVSHDGAVPQAPEVE